MAPPVAGSWPWVQMITPSDIPPEIRKTLSGTEAVTAVDSGCTSDVAFVSTGNQAFALKRSREQPHRRWLAREYEVLTALMATRLPVPKPYLFVEDEGKSVIVAIDGPQTRNRSGTHDLRSKRRTSTGGVRARGRDGSHAAPMPRTTRPDRSIIIGVAPECALRGRFRSSKLPSERRRRAALSA